MKDKLLLALKLLFSPEIYDELAQEFQATADAKRQQRQQDKLSTGQADPIPGCTHEAKI